MWARDEEAVEGSYHREPMGTIVQKEPTLGSPNHGL